MLQCVLVHLPTCNEWVATRDIVCVFRAEAAFVAATCLALATNTHHPTLCVREYGVGSVGQRPWNAAEAGGVSGTVARCLIPAGLTTSPSSRCRGPSTSTPMTPEHIRIMQENRLRGEWGEVMGSGSG